MCQVFWDRHATICRGISERCMARRTLDEFERARDDPSRRHCSIHSRPVLQQVLRRLPSAICLLGILRGAAAQPWGNCPPGSPTPALGTGTCHCWPLNVTNCCQTAADQAMQSCLEYAPMGFTTTSCINWPRNVRQACGLSCGNMTITAQQLMDDCRFSLQVLNNGPLQQAYCDQSHAAYLNYRVRVGCVYNASYCFSTQADSCMAQCGNYAKCNCRVQRGTVNMPDVCDGQMVVQLPKPGFGRNYTCADTPLQCRKHIQNGFQCANYTLCDANLCEIRNVSCPALDQCTQVGTCERTSGSCFWNDQPDGYPCDDKIPHTVQDQCVRGKCQGTMDMCKYYDVSCNVISQCLESGGVCNPINGMCVYNMKQNGAPCDDSRIYTVSDQCDNGICAGKMVDMCVERAVNCTLQLPNECHNPGVCNPRTGGCSLPVAVSGRDCNDGDPTTHNDSCIDGACIGLTDWRKFLTIGTGECSDRDGNRMPSYSGDVTEESDCEQICLSDRQCVGFSFSPPVCRVYGTIRTKPPPNYQWSFEGGTVPAAVLIEKATSITGQRDTVCRRKDLVGDVASADNDGKVGRDTIFKPEVLILFFSAVMLIFFGIPIYKCVRICFSGPRSERDLIAQSPNDDEVISYSNIAPEYQVNEYEITVERDSEGRAGFSFSMDMLRITEIDPGRSDLHEIKIGDKIVAVNGNKVFSRDEYDANAIGVAKFQLTVLREDLRRTSNIAWAPLEPHTGDVDPVSPAELPPHFMVPPEPPVSEEVVTPRQGISPMTLPPSPDNFQLPSSAAEEGQPSPGSQRWARKTGNTKTIHGVQPRMNYSQQGGPSANPDISVPAGQQLGVSPATVANAIEVGRTVAKAYEIGHGMGFI